MPKIDVQVSVDLQEVIDQALLSDIMEYLDPDQVMDHLRGIHGYEVLTDQLTLPQLLRALATRLEKEMKSRDIT